MRPIAPPEPTWLPLLRERAVAADGRMLQFMEVCGTHTVAAFRTGLHSLMPPNVRLISGPGCPVCVTSQGDIDQLIELAHRPDLTLCSYGDMLRVTGSNRRSLETARASGADVRIVYSSMDAVELATRHPDRQVVFAGVGFETTAPATAAAVEEAARRKLANFCVYTSHKLILPAMHALCSSGDVNVDGFLCPGHVSVIIGANAFRPIVAKYHLPCVVVGFEDTQIGVGIAELARLANAKEARLVNLYPQAVTGWGNRHAQNLLSAVFSPVDATWRGLGTLPSSGLELRYSYREFDARLRYKLEVLDVPEPKGCRCGDVITARCTPIDCKLFGTACTPISPIGPCMVSSEGTCQAWFKYARGGRMPLVATRETHS